MSINYMKRIFFWTNYYIRHPEIGTTSKIISEIETLRLMGFEVYYTAYLDDGVGIYDNNDRQIEYLKFFNKNRLFIRIFQKDYLIKITRRYIRNHRFEYYILRINYIGKMYFKMLQQMKSQNAFVMMESLSYYPDMNFGNIKKASYIMIGNSLKRHEHNLKTVIDLMLTEGKFENFYGIPCVEFGMGIDVKKYKRHQYCGDLNQLNLLMVGCDSIYHGTDRIILSLKRYVETKKRIDIKLHLVGDILEKDRKLIKEINLGENIICYGKQYGERLDRIFDKCNIALGPLAQHRIQKKDTGLKTKEYFARGIPYLYTGNEIKIEKNYPYIMQIEDTEELIDLEKVFVFYNSIKDNNELVDTMRMKAKNVFSWNSIFDEVINTADTIKANTKI